jgi:hypothetical protein
MLHQREYKWGMALAVQSWRACVGLGMGLRIAIPALYSITYDSSCFIVNEMVGSMTIHKGRVADRMRVRARSVIFSEQNRWLKRK